MTSGHQSWCKFENPFRKLSMTPFEMFLILVRCLLSLRAWRVFDWTIWKKVTLEVLDALLSSIPHKSIKKYIFWWSFMVNIRYKTLLVLWQPEWRISNILSNICTWRSCSHIGCRTSSQLTINWIVWRIIKSLCHRFVTIHKTWRHYDSPET